MFSKIAYALLGIVIVLGYAYVDWRELELERSNRQVIARGLRSTQGGYRSYWTSGFHGGK